MISHEYNLKLEQILGMFCEVSLCGQSDLLGFLPY